MSTSNISEAILTLLKNNKSFSLNEIAFITRTGRSVIAEVLDRLLKIKVVRQTASGYRLNPQKEYD